MREVKKGYTYGDLYFEGRRARFERGQADLSTELCWGIRIGLPFVSPPMDSVTEERLTRAIVKAHGAAVIHRNLFKEEQSAQVRRLADEGLVVGAAISPYPGYWPRVEMLVDAGVGFIVIDNAHGESDLVIAATADIKRKMKNLPVIPGNIATAEGAMDLIAAGADGLRVGKGSGAICSTSRETGMGVPQLTAIDNVASVAARYGIPVIADGGIIENGDMVKALAMGASTVMMGMRFAQATESCGPRVVWTRAEAPDACRHHFRNDEEGIAFVIYRGMGAKWAALEGASVAEAEFHAQKVDRSRPYVPEGVTSVVRELGPAAELMAAWETSLQGGFWYGGSQSIKEFQSTVKWYEVSSIGRDERQPHDVVEVPDEVWSKGFKRAAELNAA